MLYISISLYQRIATKIIKLQETTVLCSCRKRDKEQMSKIAVIYFPLLRIDWNIPGPAITKIFIMLNSVLEGKEHKFEVKSKTWGWELTWGKVVTKGPVYAYGKMCCVQEWHWCNKALVLKTKHDPSNTIVRDQQQSS